MILPNPYGPMTCRWILLGQKGFLINGTLSFPCCRVGFFIPYLKTCFLNWSSGQDQVASCSCRHVACMECMVFQPVNARCLNQRWRNGPRLAVPTLRGAREAPLHAAGRYRKSRSPGRRESVSEEQKTSNTRSDDIQIKQQANRTKSETN